MRIDFAHFLSIVILAGGGDFSAGADAHRPPVSKSVATPVPSTRLHNVFQATTNVFSGSSPECDVAFAELVRLGVKTVISVDGARPNIGAAREHGLRYIHLPIGYDGVPTNRLAELVKAARSSPGPFYVHCHHGKHRGPAAVAVICEATSGWTTNQAVAWLVEAGTASDYPGLYRSAVEFRLPEAAVLADVVDLPEVATTSSLAEAMVAIDAECERLKAAQKNGWSGLPGQPDATQAHTATILWEHVRELGRLDDTARRPIDYRVKLAESEKAASELRVLLRDSGSTSTSRDTAFRLLSGSCVACHKMYRN